MINYTCENKVANLKFPYRELAFIEQVMLQHGLTTTKTMYEALLEKGYSKISTYPHYENEVFLLDSQTNTITSIYISIANELAYDMIKRVSEEMEGEDYEELRLSLKGEKQNTLTLSHVVIPCVVFSDFILYMPIMWFEYQEEGSEKMSIQAIKPVEIISKNPSPDDKLLVREIEESIQVRMRKPM